MASIAKFDTWQNSAGTTYGACINAYHAVNNTVYTVAGTSGYDMPNMSITLTPVSSSSRFLLMFNTPGSYSGSATVAVWFTRNGTSLNSISGANYNGQSGWISPDPSRTSTAVANYIDSPATSSAITYKVRMSTDGTAYIGRRNDTYFYSSQHFTILEFAS